MAAERFTIIPQPGRAPSTSRFPIDACYDASNPPSCEWYGMPTKREITPLAGVKWSNELDAAWRRLEPKTRALDLTSKRQLKNVDAAVLVNVSELLHRLGCMHLVSGGTTPNRFGAPLKPTGVRDWKALQKLLNTLAKALPSDGRGGIFEKRAAKVVGALAPLVRMGLEELRATEGSRSTATAAPSPSSRAGLARETTHPSRQAGYVQPSREGKVSIKTFVEPQLRRNFKAIAVLRGLTLEQLLTEVLTAFVNQHGKKAHQPLNFPFV
jgi:hypothetical protein